MTHSSRAWFYLDIARSQYPVYSTALPNLKSRKDNGIQRCSAFRAHTLFLSGYSMDRAL